MADRASRVLLELSAEPNVQQRDVLKQLPTLLQKILTCRQQVPAYTTVLVRLISGGGDPVIWRMIAGEVDTATAWMTENGAI